MSANTSESIPTSQDPRTRRVVKKARGPSTPASQQSAQLEALFAFPERQIHLHPKPKHDPSSAALNAPPEIVSNVQGSSAGASSGDFHIGRKSSRLEHERQRRFEHERVEEEADREFEERREELRGRDEEKTGRNRRRREKAKARKDRHGKGEGGTGRGKGVGAGDGEDLGKDVDGRDAGGKGKIKPLKPVLEGDKEDEEGDGVLGGEVQSVDGPGLVIRDDD